EGERFSIAARRSAAGLRLEIQRKRGLARPDGPTAVVLPMSRPVRHETGPSTAVDAHVGLGRLLRHAASRGASALHLASGSVPSIGIGDAMQLLESGSALAADEILSVISAVASPGTGEPLHSATVTEWAPAIDGIARVRCISFRDHRGPGAVFRLIAARAKT